MRTIGLALLLVAGLAAAAPLPTQKAELTLTPGTPGEMRAGTTAALALEVRLAAEGFACVQPATLRIALGVDESKATDGVALVLDNATTIGLAQGASPPGQPVALSAAPNVTVLAARYAAGGSVSTFALRAQAVSIDPATACTLDPAGLAAEADVTVNLAKAQPGDPAFHPEHEEHGGFVFDKLLKPGETFEWTPTEAGRYPYHDHFRPENKGLVRVLRLAEGDGMPTIHARASGFSPAEVALKVGATVTWVNDLDAPLTISADEQHGAVNFTEPEDAALANRSKTGEAPKGVPGIPLAASAAVLALAALAGRLRR